MKTSCDRCGLAIQLLPLRDGTSRAFERSPIPISGDQNRDGWVVGWCRYRFRSVLAARPVREVPARDLPPATRVFILHDCTDRGRHPGGRQVPDPKLAAAA